MPRKKALKPDMFLQKTCPNAVSLHAWVKAFTGLNVPRRAVCPGHHAPFDYLCLAYFEPAADLVVWAPRGGGKTRLAAVATLLDLLHKPGCSIRILGGSLTQSLCMWEHLLPNLQEIAAGLIAGGTQSARRLELTNGSSAAALTQSQRAVRGLRVQKLRCDEVELFDLKIWEAAQLATRSKSDDAPAHGAIEAMSTFHKPAGLMNRIISRAEQRKTPVLRWCLLEVLEKCPPERDCAACPLWDECRGVAKTKCSGFFSIDDAITMKQRVSMESWESEMLCRRPSVQGSVFPSFDVQIHVRDFGETAASGESMSLAIDFGFHAPFVCLWIASDSRGTLVLDEYVQPQRTMSDHVQQIESRAFGKIKRVCCDPAGAGRNDQTAESNIHFLKRNGYRVHSKGSRIVDGLELVRAGLRNGMGQAQLFIHPRCKRLIAAMQGYAYPDGGGELPIKDGTHDHLIDALRYYYVNRPTQVEGKPRRY